jgi:hypothetical protein
MYIRLHSAPPEARHCVPYTFTLDNTHLVSVHSEFNALHKFTVIFGLNVIFKKHIMSPVTYVVTDYTGNYVSAFKARKTF